MGTDGPPLRHGGDPRQEVARCIAAALEQMARDIARSISHEDGCRHERERVTHMRLTGTFALDLQPGDPLTPARVKIAVHRYAQSEDGRLFITPECVTLNEIEGQINALQDELDELRARARRVFHRIL